MRHELVPVAAPPIRLQLAEAIPRRKPGNIAAEELAELQCGVRGRPGRRKAEQRGGDPVASRGAVQTGNSLAVIPGSLEEHGSPGRPVLDTCWSQAQAQIAFVLPDLKI